MNHSMNLSLRDELDSRLASEKEEYEQRWKALADNLNFLERFIGYAGENKLERYYGLTYIMAFLSFLVLLSGASSATEVATTVIVLIITFFITVPLFIIVGAVLAAILIGIVLVLLAGVQTLLLPVVAYANWRSKRWNAFIFGQELNSQIVEIDSTIECIVTFETNLVADCRDFGVALPLDYISRLRSQMSRVNHNSQLSFEEFEEYVVMARKAAERDQSNIAKATVGYEKLVNAFKQANHVAQAAQNDAMIDFAGDLQVAIANIKGYLEKREYEKYFSILKYLHEQCRLLFENARRTKASDSGSNRTGAGGQQDQRDQERRHDQKKSTPPKEEADDPYTILGLAPGTSSKAVHATWKKLLTDIHPDRVHGTTDAIFELVQEQAKRINGAYSCIKEERKRLGTW